jgi:hypothetical protein
MQDVTHTSPVSAQTNGSQGVGVGVTQMAFSHVGTSIEMPFWQEATPHAVVAVGSVHTDGFAGLQNPPHAPEPAQAGRPWRGAPETPVHVPIFVA